MMIPHDKLNRLLYLAFKHQATDIHMKYDNDKLRVELRTMSGFTDISCVDFDIDLFNYIQYIANLDLADANRPQTGTFQYDYLSELIFLRFAIIRSTNQLSGVLRILYQKVIKEKISNFKHQDRLFNNVIKQKSGLIILSGPTGSGKTSTGYALLKKMRSKRIYTIEDPIEMFIDDIIQIQVNKRQGLDYEAGIKQLMRHDPDVIYIGEIRDESEAKMAVRSALTGHLVLTTIHAKDCFGVIQRMKDLDVNMYDFYQSVIFIVNQRLIPRLYLKERTAIYETLDHEDIKYVQANNLLPKDFKNLQYYLQKAKQERLISFKTEI